MEKQVSEREPRYWHEDEAEAARSADVREVMDEYRRAYREATGEDLRLSLYGSWIQAHRIVWDQVYYQFLWSKRKSEVVAMTKLLKAQLEKQQ